MYDVRWNPVTWSAMWSALLGDPLDRPERERNLVWRNFTGLPVRIVRSEQEQVRYDEAIVADLRSSFGRYPGDSRLAQLIADLRDLSPRFCRLWEAHRVGVYDQERKTIELPELGLLHLDCEILTAHRSDLRVAVFTAAPGTKSARQLDALYAASSLQPDMVS